MVATICFLAPGILLAVWLARTTSNRRVFIQTLVAIPLVLPPVVTGLCLLKLLLLLNSSIVFTWWAAVLASGMVAIPLLVRTVQAAIETMDGRLLIAAETLGASKTRAFFTITLPLCWRGIVGGVILFWARTMGEFGAVMVVAANTPGRTQTMPLAIYSKIDSPQAGAVWPLVLVSVVLSATAVLLSEQLVRRRKSPRKLINV